MFGELGINFKVRGVIALGKVSICCLVRPKERKVFDHIWDFDTISEGNESSTFI